MMGIVVERQKKTSKNSNYSRKCKKIQLIRYTEGRIYQHTTIFDRTYVRNKARLSRYQRAQEVIDFSDDDYAIWKNQ